MITHKAKLPEVIKNIYFTKKSPISLIHFLTNRCNARCSFCFIDFDNPKTFAGELTIEEIEKLTKTMGNTLLNVNFTGGEPFARKDIIDIAKLYVKNTTIQSIYITTNGSLPDRILNFAESRPNRLRNTCRSACITLGIRRSRSWRSSFVSTGNYELMAG